MDYLLPILILIILLLILVIFFLFKKIQLLKQQLAEAEFQKSSQAVKYGSLTEQFIPFIEQFPFDPEKFRFLGEPIDGIVFEDDKIIFAEFKAASSQLNKKQRRIRELVKNKLVEWFEFNLK